MTDWLTKQDEEVAVLMAQLFALYIAQTQAMVIVMHHVVQSIRPAMNEFDARLAAAMNTQRYYT